MAAEKIEAAYKKNSLVEQIWVYGNSLESTLIAIVVPTGTHTSSFAILTAVSPHCVLLLLPVLQLVLPYVLPAVLPLVIPAVSLAVLRLVLPAVLPAVLPLV